MNNTTQPMTSREAFESWFLGDNTYIVLQRDKDGNYLYSSAYSAWQAFEAGYQASEANQQAVISEKDKQIAELRKELELYRKAVIDLSERGHGVKRPKWLIEVIDKAKVKGK